MDSKELALFITDSIGLPRSRGKDKVSLDETYIHLTKAKRPDLEIIHIGVPAGTITELHRVAEYYQSSAPKYVVLQVGIVDCAPRALGIFEFEIIKRFHVYRVIKPFARLLRKYRYICYTKPAKFEETLIQLKGLFEESIFIASGILPSCREYEQAVPSVTSRIEEFNSIIQRHTVFIDNRSFPRDGIADDFHHLNVHGNQLLADKILVHLE